MCCANTDRKAEARLELYLYQQQYRQRENPQIWLLFLTRDTKLLMIARKLQ